MYNFLPDLIFSFLFKNNILASRIYSLNCIDTFYINLWFLISLENLVKSCSPSARPLIPRLMLHGITEVMTIKTAVLQFTVYKQK